MDKVKRLLIDVHGIIDAQVKKMTDEVKRKRYRKAGGLKGYKLSLNERFEFVEGLYLAWIAREKLRLEFPIERLDGNIDLLADLIHEEFSSDLDMRRKVRAWVREVRGHLDKKAGRDILLEKVEK